jgi:hypothetical protein
LSVYWDFVTAPYAVPGISPVKLFFDNGLPQTDDLPPDAAHTQPDHEVDEANDEAVLPPGPKRDVPGVVVNRKKVPDTSREITT